MNMYNGWVGNIMPNMFVQPILNKKPCEVVKVDNLPKNLPLSSPKNVEHNYDVSPKAHGPFSFIRTRFFHTR
jgi:hypothetical protein